LILDEPYSGLDATAHQTLWELIAEATEEGTSVLISTHGTETVRGGDHVFQIDQGLLTEVQEAIPLTRSPGGVDWRIELVATPAACPLVEMESLVGVCSSDHDAAGNVLCLVVDKARSDQILTTAISRGWSVNSVEGYQSKERQR
jgi:ABC-type multidrug transport system ATPase subunit